VRVEEPNFAPEPYSVLSSLYLKEKINKIIISRIFFSTDVMYGCAEQQHFFKGFYSLNWGTNLFIFE